jgi:hypothetical protein
MARVALHKAQRMGFLGDGNGKAVPADCAIIGVMEGAARALFDQRPDGARKTRRPSGRTDLVGDDAQFITLVHQADHGPHEVCAARLVNPRGAHQQVFGTQVILTLSLGPTIGRLGVARSFGRVRGGGGAIEDVIGRYMDDLAAG